MIDRTGSQYARLKLKGIDMGWYERGKKHLVVPLEDDHCSHGSIYLIKADGTLWTLDLAVSLRGDEHHYEARPYRQVRDSGKRLSEAYVCMNSRVQYEDINEAVRHARCANVSNNMKEVM